MRAAVLLSGGLDSAVCLHLAIREHGAENVVAVTVDYDQPHYLEVGHAARLVQKSGVEHRVVTIRGLYDSSSGGFFDTSADLSDAAATVVPVRNLVLLTHAAVHGDPVIIGANADDQADYPDCRPEFFSAAERALGVSIRAPLLEKAKREVVALAKELGIPLELTLSCYRGSNCGECAACVLREGAL